MKFEIFELVTPESLKIEVPFMGYSETTEREVLQKVKSLNYGHGYDSFDEALGVIQVNRKSLKGKRLTIIPVFNISYFEDDEL